MKDVEINTEYIKLGQLLKYAGACSSGTEAKFIILEGDVTLNGVTEKQRGKKVVKGDIIETRGVSIKIV
jgi:ribosome-associated protein